MAEQTRQRGSAAWHRNFKKTKIFLKEEKKRSCAKLGKGQDMIGKERGKTNKRIK